MKRSLAVHVAAVQCAAVFFCCLFLLGVLQRVRAALEGNSTEQRTSALLEDDPTYK
jgi:hypothetical protein